MICALAGGEHAAGKFLEGGHCVGAGRVGGHETGPGDAAPVAGAQRSLIAGSIACSRSRSSRVSARR